MKNEIQTEKVLPKLEQGDKKTSQQLCIMNNLAIDKVSENFLKTFWLQRSLVKMRGILSVSDHDLYKLATTETKGGK